MTVTTDLGLRYTLRKQAVRVSHRLLQMIEKEGQLPLAFSVANGSLILNLAKGSLRWKDLRSILNCGHRLKIKSIKLNTEIYF